MSVFCSYHFIVRYKYLQQPALRPPAPRRAGPQHRHHGLLEHGGQPRLVRGRARLQVLLRADLPRQTRALLRADRPRARCGQPLLGGGVLASAVND